ncbi:hypothetical protein HZC30_03720 [Candidatus Woesearchaeota archaeon]|nr:hypothetical protein [Candidatus Woesearchaeota archaeon]
MNKKLYVVGGIREEDWDKIFSCIKFAALFADDKLNLDDLKILKNIKIRDLDINKNLKRDAEKWLCGEHEDLRE